MYNKKRQNAAGIVEKSCLSFVITNIVVVVI